MSRMRPSQYWVHARGGCATYDSEAITVGPPLNIPALPPAALIGLTLALAGAGAAVLRNVAS